MTPGEVALAAGYRLVHRDRVESTNTVALDLSEAQDRLWVVADEQTGGRGRHGRHWTSPHGNLYASLLLISPCATADAPRLGFVAGVAIAEAVRAVAPSVPARIKWPNDLVVGPAKLTGILLEGRMVGGKQAIAIGIGVNLVSHPEIPERPTTDLRAEGFEVSRETLFAALSDRFADALAAFDSGRGFAAIRARWERLALADGTPLTVRLPQREHSGLYRGIDAGGRLLLDTSGGMVHVDAGDVFLADAV